MTIPEQAVEDAIGEICADCGKEIGMLDASYYRPAAPGADFGKTYHSTCGDPFGIKAKDAEIERCHKEIARLTAALPLVGVQRPEDVARELRILLRAGGNLSDEEVEVLERNILALLAPHTGQPQEGLGDCGLETIQTLLDLLNPLHGSLDEQTYDEKYKQNFDAPRDAEYAVNVTAQQERDLTQAVLILEDRKRAAKVAAPASPRADSNHERETPVEPIIGQERS